LQQKVNIDKLKNNNICNGGCLVSSGTLKCTGMGLDAKQLGTSPYHITTILTFTDIVIECHYLYTSFRVLVNEGNIIMVEGGIMYKPKANA